MSEQMITLVLWLPFAIVAAISALIFCVAGYRRGLWNALVSLAATLIALPCSVLIAKLLAQPVSKPINRALSEAVGGTASASLMPALLYGLVCAAMTMVLYFVLMIVLTALFKYIANTLWGDRLERSSAVVRWGGIGIRLVDALLYTLLLLLPLYGTIGTVLPAATGITRVAGADQDIQKMFGAVAEHPVAKITGTGPFKSVYGQLAVVPTDSGDIQIVEFAQGVTGTVERLNQVTQAIESGDIYVELGEDLIAFVRKEVVQQDWFYAAYQEGLKQIPVEEVQEDPLMRELLELADMDQKTFAKNADVILEVAQYALEKDVPLQIQQNPERVYEILYDSGVMERLGAMINSSDESIELREFIVKAMIMEMCGDDRAASRRLTEAYRSRSNQTREDQIGDAEAMIQLLGLYPGNRRLNRYEALLRLPGMDADVVYSQFASEDIDALMHIYADRQHRELEETLAQKYGSGLTLEQMVWEELVASSRLPLDSYPRFDLDP